MRKTLYIILSALAFVMAQPTFAQDERQRKPETVVQDVLAQMPAQTAADFDREMGYLAQGAPQTIKLLVGMLQPAEKAQNAHVEYAVSGITNYVNANPQYKKAVLEGFEVSLAGTPDKTARELIETQIRLLKAVQPNVFTAHEGAAPYAEQYDKLVRNADQQTIGIAHADCQEDVDYLISLLRANHPPKDILTVMYEPVTGSHVGPGTLALFFLGDEAFRGQNDSLLGAISQKVDESRETIMGALKRERK